MSPEKGDIPMPLTTTTRHLNLMGTERAGHTGTWKASDSGTPYPHQRARSVLGGTPAQLLPLMRRAVRRATCCSLVSRCGSRVTTQQNKTKQNTQKYPNPSDLGSQACSGVASSTVGDHVRSPRDVLFCFSLFGSLRHSFASCNTSFDDHICSHLRVFSVFHLEHFFFSHSLYVKKEQEGCGGGWSNDMSKGFGRYS